jgi:SAM-dependent methyltransferase
LRAGVAAAGYDAIPYPGRAFPQTHPDRLATIGTLFGLRPAPVRGCRVLELGCGDGGNLIPIALTSGAASAVGIDAAPGAVSRARARAEALGLANVRFELADFAHLAGDGDGDGDGDGYDYVIAHGVYSWVDAAVRDALLSTCRTALRPDGVAFVSYNALPGARLRQALWDMLRSRTADLESPQDRLAAARALLEALVAGWPAEPPFVAALKVEAQRLLAGADATLFHDDLAAVNEPVLFRTFVAHAARHDLAYVGEADFGELDVGSADDPPANAVGAIEDRLAREQHLDFLEVRSFRQTLLCRADLAPRARPWAGALAGMSVSSRLRRTGAAADGGVTFASPGGATLTTDHPAVVAALERAGGAWPAAVPVSDPAGGDDAPDSRAAVREALLACCAADLLRLHVAPPLVAARAGSHPQASSLARLQAAAGSEVTSLHHTTVRIEDEPGRRLLTLLDGTRDRAALAAEMRAHLTGPAARSPSAIEATLDSGLDRLAELALLIA